MVERVETDGGVRLQGSAPAEHFVDLLPAISSYECQSMQMGCQQLHGGVGTSSTIKDLVRACNRKADSRMMAALGGSAHVLSLASQIKCMQIGCRYRCADVP